VKYELGFYIPEDTILHSRRRGNLKSYMDMIWSTALVTVFIQNSLIKNVFRDRNSAAGIATGYGTDNERTGVPIAVG
jgi:hypothetical protein